MNSNVSPDDLLPIEEAALRAWPAARQVHAGGWIVRISGGYTKRANSAVLLDPEPQSTSDRAIARIEGMYLHHGQPSIFRLLSFATPDGFEGRLAERGYRAADDTLVMTRPLAPATAIDPEVCLLDTETGVEVHARMTSLASEKVPAHRAILDRIPSELSFCGLHSNGELVACGCTVVDGAFAGLFDIVTDPAHRRQGHAHHLVRGMLDRASAHGATTAFLQVVATNTPAVALYRSLGFTPAYSYRYRILDRS